MAELEVTSSNWSVLWAAVDGPATMSEISRRMGLTRQSVQRQVSVLVDKGLLVGSPNPAHKVAMLYRLTPKGRRTLSKIDTIRNRWARPIVSEHRRSDLEAARRALRLLIDQLSRD